jgi:hypothetical protein
VTFADLLGKMTQSDIDDSTTINLGGGVRIVIENTLIEDLDASDFILTEEIFVIG